MIRPINREEFEGQLESLSVRAFVQQFKFLAKKINELIEFANAKEDKHGKWLIKIKDGKPEGTICFECSNCHRNVPFFYKFPYCPFCGAHMEDKHEGSD